MKIFDFHHKVAAFEVPEGVEIFFDGEQLVMCMGTYNNLIPRQSCNLNIKL